MPYFLLAGGSLELYRKDNLIRFEFSFDLDKYGEDGAGFYFKLEIQTAQELASFLQTEMRQRVRMQGESEDMPMVYIYRDEKHPDYIWFETDDFSVHAFGGEGLMLTNREIINNLADFILSNAA